MFKVMSRILLVLIVLSFPLQVQAFAKAMTPVDLLNIPNISEAQAMANSRKVIYAKSEANWKQNKLVKHYWMIDLQSKQKKQLTHSTKGESKGKISDNGEFFSFVRRVEKNKPAQIFVMPLSGGEAEQVTQLKSELVDYTWGKDNKALILQIKREPSKKEKSYKKKENDIVEFSEKVKHRELWSLELVNGSLKPLVRGDFSVRNFRLSRNKKKIVYTRSPTASRDDSLRSDIWIYDLNENSNKRLSRQFGSYKNIELAPNQKSLLFTSWIDERGEEYQEDNLFTLSLGTGKMTQLLGEFDHEVLAAHFSSDNSKIYFLANMGVHSELFSYQFDTRKIVQLTNGEHQIRDWRYLDNSDTHLLQIQDSKNKGDYWMLKSNSEGAEMTQLTHEFDDLEKRYQLPEQKVFRWQGEDGETIEGLVTFPLDYKPGRKYPLIVQTHGGPRTSDKFGVFHTGRYLPVMAANGYLVLQPNHRGSTGYGDRFVRNMVGGYFKQAHKDVMKGVDYLIDKGIVDATKLGKMGWSAGGHMTNKIVTYTNRFKAASSGAGAANWISMYSQSDTRIYRTPWFGGSPWKKDAPIENYWENSPLKNVHKVKTPTLILVGDRDDRVPKQQSIEFYRGLKDNGVSTKLYIAPREPHGWRELKHKLFKINVELDWFKKHIENEKYEWQKPPNIKDSSDEQ